MAYAHKIISEFGGLTKLAHALGYEHASAVQRWGKTGTIPQKHHQKIYDAAKERGIEIEPSDFLMVSDSSEDTSNSDKQVSA